MRSLREGVAAGLEQAAREVTAQAYQIGEMADATSTPPEDRVLLHSTRAELRRIASVFARMASEWSHAAQLDQTHRTEIPHAE